MVPAKNTAPATSKLFGDDIGKAIKNAKQAEEVTREWRDAGSKNWKRKNHRNFNPFQNRYPYNKGQGKGGKRPDFYKKKGNEQK